MTVIDRRPFTAAVIALLVQGTGKQVGDHEIPVAAVYPYCIVYSSVLATNGPPLWSPDADGDLEYQVTSVGLRRDQCEWMGDIVRRSVLSRAAGQFQVPFVSPAGWVCSGRLLSASPGVPEQGGTPKVPIWSSAESFTFQVTPS